MIPCIVDPYFYGGGFGFGMSFGYPYMGFGMSFGYPYYGLWLWISLLWLRLWLRLRYYGYGYPYYGYDYGYYGYGYGCCYYNNGGDMYYPDHRPVYYGPRRSIESNRMASARNVRCFRRTTHEYNRYRYVAPLQEHQHTDAEATAMVMV